MSISTISSRSTTATATPRAMPPCARRRNCCAASVRAGDLVARLGGDEFAAWMAEVDGAEMLRRGQAAGRRPPRRCSASRRSADKKVGFSVGIAGCVPGPQMQRRRSDRARRPRDVPGEARRQGRRRAAGRLEHVDYEKAKQLSHRSRRRNAPQAWRSSRMCARRSCSIWRTMRDRRRAPRGGGAPRDPAPGRSAS